MKTNRIPFRKTLIITRQLSEFTLGMIHLDRKTGTRGVFSLYTAEDDGSFHTPKVNSSFPFRTHMLKRLAAVFPESNDLSEQIRLKNPGLKPGSVIVHRPGVGEVDWVNADANRSVLRILTASCLEKSDRLTQLVEAFESLEGIQIEWFHVGDGTDRDSIQQFAFNHLFNKPNIRFRFSSGLELLTLPELASEIQPHVFVHIGIWKKFPTLVLQAFGMGLPVILSNGPAACEWLKNQKNGILLGEEPDSKQIAEALKLVATWSEETFQYMRINARETYLQMGRSELNHSGIIYDMVQLSRQFKK